MLRSMTANFSADLRPRHMYTIKRFLMACLCPTVSPFSTRRSARRTKRCLSLCRILPHPSRRYRLLVGDCCSWLCCWCRLRRHAAKTAGFGSCGYHVSVPLLAPAIMMICDNRLESVRVHARTQCESSAKSYNMLISFDKQQERCLHASDRPESRSTVSHVKSDGIRLAAPYLRPAGCMHQTGYEHNDQYWLHPLYIIT